VITTASSLTDDQQLVSPACFHSGVDGRYEPSMELAVFLSRKISMALGIDPNDLTPLHPLHPLKLVSTIEGMATWVPRDPPPLVRRPRFNKRVRDGGCHLALHGGVESFC
jgi:hypothetical protein